MFNWFKNYLGSFFNNNCAKNMKNRTFWNVLLSFILYIVILTSFYSVTYDISFSYHLNRSDDFFEFVETNLLKTNEEINLKIETIDDKKQLIAYQNNQRFDVINSFYESDKDHSINGYNIIIDGRDPYKTLFDFNFVKDGNYISKNEFLSLSDKTGYTLNILDNTLLSLDNNEVTNYLANNEQYKALSEEEKLDNYNVYSLYLLDRFSDVFVSKDYLPNPYFTYWNKYYSTNENGDFNYTKILIITPSYTIVNFFTNKNVEMYFIGFYDMFNSNYQLIGDNIINNKPAMIEKTYDLFNLLFDSTTSSVAITRAYTLFVNMPTMIILLLIVSLFIFLICKLTKQSYVITYSESFKLVSSFLFGSSIIAALSSIISSYFLSTAIVLYLGFGIFASSIIIRTFIFVIVEYSKFKKNPAYDKVAVNNENAEPIGNNLDLASAKSKVKVIVNDNSDDDEKMEFM